jgi:hypothetical protein
VFEQSPSVMIIAIYLVRNKRPKCTGCFKIQKPGSRLPGEQIAYTRLKALSSVVVHKQA